MTARKKGKKRRPPVAQSGDAKTASEPPESRPEPSAREAVANGSMPSPNVRTVLSIWLAIHLFALAISFTSVVEPSSVHARLGDLLRPYLRPTHFSADDRPVYLTHGEPSEQPHRLQITRDQVTSLEEVDSLDWELATNEVLPGMAASDRLARWLSTVATLAESEQPSLVAEMLLPIARQHEEAVAIRIARLPTDLNDINTGVATPYVARIIRSGDSISLVAIQPRRLSAPASGGPASGAPASGAPADADASGVEGGTR